MQTKPPILLATIVLGVLAVGGGALMLLKKPVSDAPPAGATVAMAAVAPTPIPEMRYIANRDIPPRTMVTSDMLRRTTISGPMPAGAVTTLEDLHGKITSKPIRAGDVITQDSFVSRLERVIPARFEIPSGFRAVAIYVDPNTTAAGMVDVGDRVDVIATQKLEFDKADGQVVVGAKQFMSGRTIATDLLVLAVDQSLQTPVVTPTPEAPPASAAPAPAGDASVAPPPQPQAAPPADVKPDSAPGAASGKIRVFLAAPIETASRLVTANDGGTLHIVIRNPQDGDAQGAPETREYPSRLITVAKPKANAGAGNVSLPSMPVPELPDVTVRNTSNVPAPPLPMPIQASSPASSSVGSSEMASASAPAAPPTSDIMVVRGTEKTRVIVPKR